MIVETRRVGNSQMYQINRGNPAAEESVIERGARDHPDPDRILDKASHQVEANEHGDCDGDSIHYPSPGETHSNGNSIAAHKRALPLGPEDDGFREVGKRRRQFVTRGL